VKISENSCNSLQKPFGTGLSRSGKCQGDMEDTEIKVEPPWLSLIRREHGVRREVSQEVSAVSVNPAVNENEE